MTPRASDAFACTWARPPEERTRGKSRGSHPVEPVPPPRPINPSAKLPVMRFTFLDPGPLVDGELRLIEPEARWVDDLLLAQSQTDATAAATGGRPVLDPPWPRHKILEFL